MNYSLSSLKYLLLDRTKICAWFIQTKEKVLFFLLPSHRKRNKSCSITNEHHMQFTINHHAKLNIWPKISAYNKTHLVWSPELCSTEQAGQGPPKQLIHDIFGYASSMAISQCRRPSLHRHSTALSNPHPEARAGSTLCIARPVLDHPTFISPECWTQILYDSWSAVEKRSWIPLEAGSTLWFSISFNEQTLFRPLAIPPPPPTFFCSTQTRKLLFPLDLWLVRC